MQVDFEVSIKLFQINSNLVQTGSNWFKLNDKKFQSFLEAHILGQQ